MKTKRLIIILGVIIFLTLILVLCGAVFTVQKIEVDWATQPNVLTVNDNDDIIKSSKIKYKSSIFTLKKQTYINNIEKSKAYIEVLGIEIKFPNKVIIHAREREAYFYLNLGNQDYAILDKSLKVLELTQDVKEYANQFGISPIELNIESTYIANLNVQRGEQLKIACFDTLTNFTNYLNKLNYDTLRAKVTIKTVKLKDKDMGIYTNLGLNIYVNDITTDFNNKLLKGFSAYEQYKDEMSTGTILCYTNNCYYVNNGIEQYI